MTEREVMRLMRAVHELDVKEREERYAQERAECLSLPRFCAALLRGGWTAAERAHIGGCAYCQKTREKVQRVLWHPTLWQVFLHNLNGGVAEVAYHLEQDKCQPCLARCRCLEKVRNCIVSFLSPIPLRNPQVALAATGEPLDVTATSPDQRIEVQLVEDRDAMVLEVRTKDVALNHQLFGYALRDADGQEAVTGFLVLREDVNDWYAAHVTFDLNELFATLNGQCRNAVVSLVEADMLTEAEREALLASVARDRDDAEAQAAWRAWAERAEQSGTLPDDARQLIRDVRERLGHRPCD